MSRVSCGRRFVLSLSRHMLLAAVVSSVGIAGVRAAEESPVRAEVLAALTKRVTAEFLEAPLKDVVDFLSDQADVTIRIDRKSLDDAGIALDSPCSLRLKNVTLRTLLNRLDAEYQISWVVRPWGIELVSSDRAESQLVMQVRDVSDLAPPSAKVDDEQGRFEVVQELTYALKFAGTPAAGWVDDGGIGRIAVDRSGNLVVTTLTRTQHDLDHLLAAIRDASRQPADELRLVARSATSFPALSPVEQELTKAMQQLAQFGFDATPFQEVLEFLSHKYKIPIQLDRRALEANGIAADTPITENIRKATLRDALQLLCESLNLTFVIRDELVIVTTRDQCEAAPVSRVYPASDFAPTDDLGLARELLHEVANLVREHSAAPNPGWDEDGGVGRIAVVPVAKALVISTTPDGHESVANLLAELRRNRGDRPVPMPDENQVVYRVYPTMAFIQQDSKNLSDEKVTELVMQLLGDVKWDKPTYFLKVLGNLVYVRQTLGVHRKIEKLMPGHLAGVIGTSPVPVVGRSDVSYGTPSR